MFFVRLRQRLSAWRRTRALRKPLPALREFIYLDEVSVYSLTASRLGPIATQFTETERATLQGEAGTSVGAGVPGVAKAEVSGRAITVRTQETQVLKKSLVQTTFKRLYDLEANALTLRAPDDDLNPPSPETLESIIANTESLAKDRWIIDPRDLCRGQLLDIDVTLDADAVFRVSAIVSAVLDILEGNPELFGSSAYRGLGEVRSIARVLEKLLAGLVPVRGKSVEYSVLESDGMQWLVHNRLVDTLDPEAATQLQPLYIVGVAEQALFWRDIRRVLFSNWRFRVFGRLARDSIHTSWTPVKLAQVLESVVPGLGKEIGSLGAGALAAMSGGSSALGGAGLRRERFVSALVRYAGLLATHYDGIISEDDLIQAGLPSERSSASYESLPARREAFDEIAQFVCDKLDVPRDNLILARYRQAALLDAGIDLSGNLLGVTEPLEIPESTTLKERYLDAEFVAIYW